MKTTTRLATVLLSGIAAFGTHQAYAQASQAITGVISTYGGYWKSENAGLNPVKPDNSHDLLAFRYNGVYYSTGVNDALLSSNSQVFSAQQYQALPVGAGAITGTIGANTKAALGQMYDGVNNGAPAITPVNNIPLYLTDGVKGLNLGTGIANLPVGTLTFSMPNLNSSTIGDGIPDVIITQIAQPSGGIDYYQFTNDAGVRVGDSIGIDFSGIGSVGTWTGDFYEASQNPMTLTTGFTNSDRDLRMWAADLSVFGITTANAANARKLVIRLNGNSDIAFIAYNEAIGTVLPVDYAYFDAALQQDGVHLYWQTLNEKNSAYFEIEAGTDGKHFSPLDRVAAAGNSSQAIAYTYTDKRVFSGPQYYRLKQVDQDGKAAYSVIREVTAGTSARASFVLSPNPAAKELNIGLAAVAKGSLISIYNLNGVKIASRIVNNEVRINMDISRFEKGIYLVTLQDANGAVSQSTRLVVQ